MKKNEKGFSVVEVIVVLVVAGLLGAVGWYIWQSKDKENDTARTAQNKSSSAQNQQTNEPDNSASYLTLTDFKVRIPLNDKTSDLKLGSVTTSSYNEADKRVPILAPELDEDWKCEADADGNFKGTVGAISITMQTKRSGPGEPLAAKKIGDYTYGFEPGAANCTDSSKYQQLIDAFTLQFNKIEAY